MTHPNTSVSRAPIEERPARPERDPLLKSVEVASYRVRTDTPESDGTLSWDHTDLVIARISAGDENGLGWSYASPAAAALIEGVLRPVVIGRPALDVAGAWQAMNLSLRNVGVPGAGMMAISAVDIALWDLKAKLLDTPLVALFGAVRDRAPLYGSGGFTSYDEQRLAKQLSGWMEMGIPRVKMKVGRDPAADLGRVRQARRAIGAHSELFVDANGAYTVKQALDLANRFADEAHVSWFEEPRPSSDLAGLQALRERAPAGMDIAAGEYGDTLPYFRRMLEARSVDCLQADVTRCGGYSGFLKVAALCDAFEVPLSAHCAPQLHAHVACATSALRHVEYFHDHTRIDELMFDGVLRPQQGFLCPDRGRRGHGLTLKPGDAERYRL